MSGTHISDFLPDRITADASKCINQAVTISKMLEIVTYDAVPF